MDLIDEYFTKVKKGIQNKEAKYKNEIHLKYLTEKEGKEYIFESSFIENNSNNISLVINGQKSPLIGQYNLKKEKIISQFVLKIH